MLGTRAVRGAVNSAVNSAVSGAVNWAVYGAISDAVYGAVNVAVSRTVYRLAAHGAAHEPNDPLLQEQLHSLGYLD